MEEIFENADLDNLILKDKEYYRKKRIKALIIIFIIIIIIGILVGIIFIIIKEFLRIKGGKIICSFLTSNDNKNIQIININEDIKFSLIIDGKEYDKNNYHSFEKAGLHNVTFAFKNKLDSLEGFFNENNYLIEADFSQLETENIKSMAFLFKESQNLEKVNFGSNFDTSKVTNMQYLFYSCKGLNEIDLSSFKLENLINAEYMFGDCIQLKEIIFNNNTRSNNLEVMNNMFTNCSSLEYINTKILRTNKVKNLNYVFANCISLKEINISHFDSKNIKELKGNLRIVQI